MIVTRLTAVAAELPSRRMQSPLRVLPAACGCANRTSRMVTSATGIEQVPLAAVQMPEPMAIACVCSSVFVAADVSMTSLSTVMSLAPGSREITDVVAAF
ncbi:MAG TPA: hypothetical protein VLJ59_11145 [Mycobacteriales bacterium]|nr:hypothetical protein [Mycobacteriales bacterium]